MDKLSTMGAKQLMNSSVLKAYHQLLPAKKINFICMGRPEPAKIIVQDPFLVTKTIIQIFPIRAYLMDQALCVLIGVTMVAIVPLSMPLH